MTAQKDSWRTEYEQGIQKDNFSHYARKNLQETADYLNFHFKQYITCMNF